MWLRSRIFKMKTVIDFQVFIVIMFPDLNYNIKFNLIKYMKTQTDSILSYVFQQSEMIVVPGSIHSLITSRVVADRFSTTTKNICQFLVPHHQKPKLHQLFSPDYIFLKIISSVLYFTILINEILYFFQIWIHQSLRL